MTASMLLVDPLAAFFRTELAGCRPLTLDSTHVDITLLPPLAQVVVVRQFTNTSDQRIEAVLTLPPLAPEEVVFRLIVSIGGTQYDATPRGARRARRDHDAAIAEGHRAILFELLKHDIPIISVAGIEPGYEVEIQIWSVKPLERNTDDLALLFVPLSARHDFVVSGLLDADAPVTTSERHTATLAVHAPDLQVTLCGQGNPYPITSRDPISIDCAAPVQLEIVPELGGSIDHCAWQVDQIGGWEVTSARGTETFRHPMNPEGILSSDRSDWIFGVMATRHGEIRVTAPLPTEGIAPNARAMRAFAAAGFRESATTQDPEAVRRTANILSRKTSLAFIGPEGELSHDIPVMRKLALSEMLAIGEMGVPPEPVGLEPFDYETPAAPPEPSLPRKLDDPIAPGARITPNAQVPRYRLLPWLVAAVAMLILSGIFQLLGNALPPRLLGLLVLITLAALAALPHDRLPIRRRLPMLILLVTPWIAALIAGPLLDDRTYGGAPPPGWMIPTQLGLLAVSAVLPLAMMPFMRGARHFTLALGIFNFALTAFVTIGGILLLTPD
ncbi:VIT domain-containing protein [Sphingobium subterraneum]|uniref:VIT domain-containing protein n=1 Tax=Sphingobium subterraneum TaxID=627688 RepID=A0A841J2Y6_9SPHN|nr:VIT domain-containing protein [Sphingobium subterraneum]MBB6125040.1 hypothetical protein [Sphingobium subterraneum]